MEIGLKSKKRKKIMSESSISHILLHPQERLCNFFGFNHMSPKEIDETKKSMFVLDLFHHFTRNVLSICHLSNPIIAYTNTI